MKKPSLTFVLLFFLWLNHLFAFTQKENNNWCFGSNAGLDFNNGTQVPFQSAFFLSGALEGVSGISDASGNLLFYTNGITVYNKNHVQMPNGINLLGHFSTSEGALVVPQPGSPNLYFIFSLDQYNGINGLHYSVVDMNAAGGLGDVTVANVPLSAGTIYSEKMIGIRHSNGIDVWVIVHTSSSNDFHSYLITSAGINPVPLLSTVGQVLGFDDAVGTMRCSFDGTRIAASYWGPLSGFELFDFDKSTGILSNPLFLTDPLYYYAYSVCFSPNGQYLYLGCCNTFKIYQFDLSIAIPPGVLVASPPNLYVGDMQLGPDSIVYVSLHTHNYLSAFMNPDSGGAACNWQQNAVSLFGGTTCALGLPNYIYPEGNALPTALFNAQNHICPGTCTDFSNLSMNSLSYLWIFPGANPAASTDVNPSTICYNTPGNYDVTLIATNAIGSDTLLLQNYITVYPAPAPQGIQQSGDTLFAIQGGTSYQWYFNGSIINGATDYFYVAPQSGNYNVVVADNNGCEVEAVINDVLAHTQSAVESWQIAIYPNPVVETLSVIGYSLSGTAAEILIYNVLGEKIVLDVNPTMNREQMTVDCRPLPSGTYYIQIMQQDKMFRAKFLKQ